MARRGRSRETAPSADTSELTLGSDLDGLLEPLPALPVDPVSSLDMFVGPSLPFDRRAFSFHEQEMWHGRVPDEAVKSSGMVGGGAFSPRVVVGDRKSVSVCVRRAQRREVLFAFRKAGRGGSRRNVKRRYNEWSEVHCR